MHWQVISTGTKEIIPENIIIQSHLLLNCGPARKIRIPYPTMLYLTGFFISILKEDRALMKLRPWDLMLHWYRPGFENG